MNAAYALRRFIRRFARNSSPTSDNHIFTNKDQGRVGRNWLFIKLNSSGLTITGTISGFLTPLPRIGDEFHSKLPLSGIAECFVVRSVRYPGNPPDKFLADVELVGYI